MAQVALELERSAGALKNPLSLANLVGAPLRRGDITIGTRNRYVRISNAAR